MRRLLKSRIFLAALSSAVTLALASGAALAAVGVIPGEDGIIHACYKTQDGQLRVVAAGAACDPSETALQWNQSGSPGAPGAAGPAGPQGPQGPAGAGASASVTTSSNLDYTSSLTSLSGTWTTLGSVTVTGSGAFVVQLNAQFETVGGGSVTSGRLVIDGAPLGDANFGMATAGSSAQPATIPIAFTTSLAAGTHQVDLQARNPSGTAHAALWSLQAVAFS